MRRIAPEDVPGLIRDGDTVTVSGLVGNMIAERSLEAIEAAFCATGHPRDLTEIHPWFYGWENGTGLNHWAHAGLCRRMIGSTSIPPYASKNSEINALAHAEQVAFHVWPANAIFQMHRAVAAGRRGFATTVGIDTFADPHRDGGKMNATARADEDFIHHVDLLGEDHLFYRSLPMQVALISAATSDTAGNLACDLDGLTQGILLQATAAKNSGGIVIAEVGRIVERGTLHPLMVEVPGHLVDYVVVDPDWEQHCCGPQRGTELATTGAIRQPLPPVEFLPQTAEKIIGRRATQEIVAGQTVNMGGGIPGQTLPRVMLEENRFADVRFTVEHGTFGDWPGAASWNAYSIHSPAWLLDWYNGGALDVSGLGAGQIDRWGNVNVGKMGDQYPGPGGFTDIAASARKVLFMATFSAGGLDVGISDQGLQIRREGKHPKFVADVECVTFSANRSRVLGQEILYITERAVFGLSDEGIELREIAPGIDLEADVLAQIPFPVPVSPDLRRMDPRLFRLEPLYADPGG